MITKRVSTKCEWNDVWEIEKCLFQNFMVACYFIYFVSK